MAACTLDPTRVSTLMTLSNGNLSWTGTSNSLSACVYGTLGYLAGTGSTNASFKLYFEATVNNIATGASFGPGIGLGVASSPTNEFLGQVGANSVGFYTHNGFVEIESDHVATYFTSTTGAIIGVAVDFFNQKMWFTQNGTTWNNDIITNQNPATNTGGVPDLIDIFVVSSVYQTIYPGFNNGDGAAGNAITANFGASSFTYTVPSGFTAWSPATSSPTQGMFALVSRF